MLRPVIFIGCGGSGEKAVRYVRDAVMRKLDHCGWTNGMPSGWQFIALDTLTTQESPTEIPTIPAKDFLTLSAEHDAYSALHRALVARHNSTKGSPEHLCGWLPDPGQVRIPLKDGAGQNRAIGRASGLRSLEQVLSPRLSEAFDRAQSGGQELHEASKYLGSDSPLGSRTPEPLVIVCSSMAGGTGAGVALDVVDLLRASDPLGGHPSLVLFGNDIFDLPNQQAMAANSLGFMSEMLAAYWSEPGDIGSLFSTDMVQNPGVGPHSVFILGRSGLSGSNLGSTAEVYQAVGEALSTWVTSEVVQERIHNFINVNWRNEARRNYGGYPFGREQQFGAVSSFGASKITVGRDRFAQWAEDRIARELLDSLASGHLRLNSNAQDGNSNDDEMIAQLAEQYAPVVYSAQPFGVEDEEAAPGCRGAAAHFAPNDRVRDVAVSVEQSLTFPSEQKASGQQWADHMKSLGRRLSDEASKRAAAEQDGEWCQQMVKETCKAASHVAGVSSLPVAIAALSRAADYLNPAEVDKVRERAGEANEAFQQQVSAALKSMERADGQISGEDPRLKEASRQMSQGIARYWQSLRLDAAASAMESAGREVFHVMAAAFKSALRHVSEALDLDEVKAWPKDGTGVPMSYLPSTVELPLESHEQWSPLLDDLCSEAAMSDVPYGIRTTDPLRYKLIAGTALSSSGQEIAPLVSIQSGKWIPGQISNLACNASKTDIEDRVLQWTRDRNGRFMRVVGEGLASYLAQVDPHTGARRVDHADRMATFRMQLGMAKQQSTPLIEVDTDLNGECHNSPLSLLMVCSQFPFPEGHPAVDAARDIIGADAFVPSIFDTPSVLVSQYLASPMHPLVVRTFTDPVKKALATVEDAGERAASFWMWRRGRRLDGFVPLPRTVLRTLVKGFAVARLCGYVTADIDSPVRITGGGDEIEFPYPLLSLLSVPDDILAGLLEAFSLTFGLVGSRGFSTYVPYQRLYELGEAAERDMLPKDLSETLATGVPPSPPVSGETPKIEGASIEERRDSAKTYINANIAWFQEQRARRDKYLACNSMNGRVETGVATMEMADLFTECYEDLIDLLNATETRGSVV